MQDFSGWALFIDSDVIFREDIARLWALRDSEYAIQVVKHDYVTSAPRKYVGSPIEADNLNYPKKNFSSVMLMNCGHPAMRALTAGYVSRHTSQHLHRFEWLDPALIGELPARYNHLVGEVPASNDAAIVHHTLGAPGFEHYADSEHSRDWHGLLLRANEMIGENPVAMVYRASERVCG